MYKATAYDFEETGCLLVDMPYTFLKSLHINQVKFHKKYEGMEYDIENYISLILLSQLNDVLLSDENNERKDEIDSKYPVVEHHNIAWIYSYDNILTYTIYNVKENLNLKEEEVDIILEYYRKFQLNKSNKPTEDHEVIEEGYEGTGWIG
ncbi:hypothetical protein J3Q64DRAFT_1835002 [Phycomyces blakesleeanus]